MYMRYIKASYDVRAVVQFGSYSRPSDQLFITCEVFAHPSPHCQPGATPPPLPTPLTTGLLKEKSSQRGGIPKILAKNHVSKGYCII